jgi:hypothetical protein
MSAKIYDFMAEKIKRETPELFEYHNLEPLPDFKFSKSMLFTKMNEMPPMMGEDAIDKILKDLGIELKKDD